MTHIFEGVKYYVDAGTCEACNLREECSAHNDRWYHCKCQDHSGNWIINCPNAVVAPVQYPYKTQQYKAAYVDTPEGRKLEVKAV